MHIAGYCCSSTEKGLERINSLSSRFISRIIYIAHKNDSKSFHFDFRFDSHAFSFFTFLFCLCNQWQWHSIAMISVHLRLQFSFYEESRKSYSNRSLFESIWILCRLNERGGNVKKGVQNRNQSRLNIEKKEKRTQMNRKEFHFLPLAVCHPR